MLKRIIPSSNESLPVIGIGSWKQFDVDTRSSEKKSLTQILQLMNQQGARVIDSSPMYGRAEEVIGELTHSAGVADDQFFYATKVWTSGRESGIRQMQESMQKMQRQTMDLIQIHNLVDWQTHLKTLQQWKAEGRTRYTGITHYTSAFHTQLEHILKTNAIDFVQFNYSIATRDAEKSLLRAAMDKGVAVIINEPLEKGALFAKVRGRSLPSWAEDYDIKSWGQFFLKYIISHPAVTCVIAGTSDPSHMLDNIMAGQGKIPGDKERTEMAEWFDQL